MKMKCFASILTASAIALSATLAIGQPSRAQNVTFVCATNSSNGLPTTYAKTPRGDIPVIRWYSQYFSDSGYTPQQRCQEVSTRFQNLHNQKLLSNITTGIVNGQPVVCAASGGGCNSKNLLFTLKPGEDAAAVVQKLFDIRAGAAVGPLFESSADEDNSITIDMNNFLNNAPVEKISDSPSSTPAAAPSTPSMPSQPSSGGSGW